MPKDWEEPRDKGPKVEETDRRWKFRNKGKKTFIIERRYVGPPRTWLPQMWEDYREWHTDRKYETERARQEAFTVLTRRQGTSYSVYDRWEYRLA